MYKEGVNMKMEIMNNSGISMIDLFINWYSELRLEKQLEFLNALNDMELLEFLENEKEENKFLVEAFMKEIEGIYNENGQEGCINFLNNNDVYEQILIKSIVEYLEVKNALFLDASILRDLDDHTFNQLISSVIKHFYIDREHRSAKKLKEELQLNLEVVDISLVFKIINYAINVLYTQQLSYLSLSNLLSKELGLGEEKKQTFIEIIKENQAQLDRYYIIKTINQLKRDLLDV